MSGRTALLAAAAALGLLGAGCKSYEKQGSAQQAGRETPPAEDPAYRYSSGVHGDENTLDDRTGVFNASGHRGDEPKH